MNASTLLGVAAAACSVAAFAPQTYKIIKTRETKDLSLPMWILQVIGFAFWIAYGISTKSWPIIAPNIITFLFSCVILGMKVFA